MIIIFLCVSKADYGIRACEHRRQRMKENISEKYNDSDYILRMCLIPDDKKSLVAELLALIVEIPEPRNSVSVVE